MKLIEQKILYFKQGSSDKVYEVDLCEVSDDSFVVNFRFGRSSGSLRDGSKTPVPVSEEKARKIFDDLVESKVRKGYVESLSSATESHDEEEAGLDEEELKNLPKADDPREQAIIKRIAEGTHSQSKWTLERAVWKAGEYYVRDAAPIMGNYLGKSGMLDYTILWALGRCGSSMVLPYVKKVIQNGTSYRDFDNDSIRRMAFSTAISLSSGFDRTYYINEYSKDLPANIQTVLKEENADDLENLLATVEEQPSREIMVCLEKLYVINPPGYKKWFLKFLLTLPFVPGYFQFAKHIYKISEQRCDADVFSLLSHRFEIEKAYYSSPQYIWGKSFYAMIPEKGYIEVDVDSLKDKEPPVCYSTKTKNYLRRRTWKTLLRLGECNSRHYVRMAAALLRQVSSSDEKEPYKTVSWEWSGKMFGGYNEIDIWRTRFAHLISFNLIMYGGGKDRRIVMGKKRKGVVCRNWKPGDDIPAEREEMFPHLWDKAPGILVDVILESDVEEVHNFAVKILKANEESLKNLEEEAIIGLLASEFKCTADLALNTAIAVIEERKSSVMFRALLDSEHSEHRQKAYNFLHDNRLGFESDTEILSVAFGTRNAESREKCCNLLKGWMLSQDKKAAILKNLIRWCTEDKDEEYRQALVEVVKTHFSDMSRSVDLQTISSLFENDCVEVQEIAALLLAGHGLAARDLPPGLLIKLFNSPSENLRDSGMRMLSQFNDMELIERTELIHSLLTHEREEIRQNAQPIFIRLCTASSYKASELVDSLLSLLIRGRVKQEILLELSKFINLNLTQFLNRLPKERIKKLLTVKVAAANVVGGTLMNQLSEADFDNDELAKMLNSETAVIRENSQKLIKNNMLRFENDPESFVAALDSDWEDSKEFTFELFNSIGDKLEAETLIAVCDSTDDRVQRFGRELLMNNFKKEDGLQYILQLSEHPSQNLQLFVSTFLESELTGKPEKLSELLPFFRTCLSKVNKGRIIKQRLLLFMEKESLASKEAAEILLPLIKNLSAASAVELKAATIKMMVKINRQWSDLKEEAVNGV